MTRCDGMTLQYTGNAAAYLQTSDSHIYTDSSPCKFSGSLHVSFLAHLPHNMHLNKVQFSVFHISFSHESYLYSAIFIQNESEVYLLNLKNDTRYDTRCYFNVHSIANMSKFNLQHRNINTTFTTCIWPRITNLEVFTSGKNSIKTVHSTTLSLLNISLRYYNQSLYTSVI